MYLVTLYMKSTNYKYYYAVGMQQHCRNIKVLMSFSSKITLCICIAVNPHLYIISLKLITQVKCLINIRCDWVLCLYSINCMTDIIVSSYMHNNYSLLTHVLSFIIILFVKHFNFMISQINLLTIEICFLRYVQLHFPVKNVIKIHNKNK